MVQSTQIDPSTATELRAHFDLALAYVEMDLFDAAVEEYGVILAVLEHLAVPAHIRRASSSVANSTAVSGAMKTFLAAIATDREAATLESHFGPAIAEVRLLREQARSKAGPAMRVLN